MSTVVKNISQRVFDVSTGGRLRPGQQATLPALTASDQRRVDAGDLVVITAGPPPPAEPRFTPVIALLDDPQPNQVLGFDGQKRVVNQPVSVPAGSISPAKLSFDPATQAELDAGLAGKAGLDEDGRVLDGAGTPVGGVSGVREIFVQEARPSPVTSPALWIEVDVNGDLTGHQEVYA